MKRRKTSKGILVDVALLLLSLMCITACISSGILAKYTSGAAGSDKARLARFDFELTPPENASVELDGGKAVYTFSVKNKSEVAASCSIILTFPDINTCKCITATCGDKDGVQDGNVITITDIAVIAPGAELKDQSFTIEVDLSRYTGGESIDFDTAIRLTQVN